LISIVSHSSEIRVWARAILIAVGVDAQCLCDVDAEQSGWRERLALSTLIVTDVVTAAQLPDGFEPQVFRVISDSSLEELKHFSGG